MANLRKNHGSGKAKMKFDEKKSSFMNYSEVIQRNYQW